MTQSSLPALAAAVFTFDTIALGIISVSILKHNFLTLLLLPSAYLLVEYQVHALAKIVVLVTASPQTTAMVTQVPARALWGCLAERLSKQPLLQLTVEPAIIQG